MPKSTPAWRLPNPLIIAVILGLIALLILVNTWRTLAQVNSPVNLGDHGIVQYVDPDGINNIYFQKYFRYYEDFYEYYSEATIVDFAAYPLNGSQFSALFYSVDRSDKLAVPDNLSAYPQPISWQVDLGTIDTVDGMSFIIKLPDIAAGLYLITAQAGEDDSSPIPAGFEGINERLNTVQYTGGSERFYWEDYGYNRKDFRDDSVDYFITRFDRGERDFSYLMRAITPGEFSILPAEARAMYREEIWGRSDSEKMLVEPERLVERPDLTGDFDNDCRITRFDLQQIVGEWGTTTLPSVLSGSDGVIDLTDVTLLGSREGASCAADYDAALDTANGEANFTIDIPSGEYGVGEAFSVNIFFASTSGLDGFDVKLAFDAGALGVQDVEWNPKLNGALKLGPNVNRQQGHATLGIYDMPLDLVNGDLLATVTFVNLTVGEATLQATGAQAINANGQLITARAAGVGNIITQGEQFFMPLLFK